MSGRSIEATVIKQPERLSDVDILLMFSIVPSRSTKAKGRPVGTESEFGILQDSNRVLFLARWDW
jgi:hypothetical protein